ncbi:MAG: hypothetical protein ACE5GJ_05255 [Gemmatimonadota bacterium]
MAPETSHPLRLILGLALAVTAAACGDAPAAPEMEADGEPAGAVIGRLYAPIEADFSSLTAQVSWGDQMVTSPVNGDGTFALPLVERVEGFGILTLEPEPASAFNPAWVLLLPGDLNGQGSVVLTPRKWTVSGGMYAGQAVDIHPELATDVKVLPSYWGTFFPYRQDGFLQTIVDNTVWTGKFQTWPEPSLPIPVALDRPGSRGAFAQGDSALFWSHIADMEEALGRDVFRPVPLEDVVILSGTRRARGAILVRMDSTLTDRGRGTPSTPDPWNWALSADASTWSQGQVSRIGFVSDDIEGGIVSFHDSDLLRNRALVIHEMMHTLGAGHGCSWPSVQTYCASLKRDLPTAQDVAYLEVLEAMRTLEQQHNTRWGLLAAAAGARVVTLGLGPVPTPALVFGPGNSSGR